MKTITVKMIRSWESCYDPTKFVPENWTGTALDVLALNHVPPEDRLWVVLREEVLPKSVLRKFARWCALQVVHLWNASEHVLLYLRTGNEELRAAAASAAWDAVRDAVRGTVRDAVRAATWAAAWAAAWAATGDTAWAAAQAAAWATVRAAEGDAAWVARNAMLNSQVEKLKELIEKEVG